MTSIVVLTSIGIIFILDGGACSSERASWSSNYSCGVDKSPYFGVLFVGVGDSETYPWLGTLVYPVGELKMTAVVVLVTRQIAVALASSIEQLPKHDFRFRSRVVLGRACSGPVDEGIRVREYAFPPGYSPQEPNIAMLQLDVDNVREELEIACQPPIFITVNPELYVVSPRDCGTGKLILYKVKLISLPRCKVYFRKVHKKINYVWPANVLCIRAAVKSSFRWREGSALILKQSGQWSFLGFTLRGASSLGPVRFVEYGAQHAWLRRSVARAGSPAITRLADNRIVMRRNLANIQRFGPCDPEELGNQIYSENITMKLTQVGVASYNLTLVQDMEYSCVVMEVKPLLVPELEPPPQPRIVLRRWCAGPPQLCYGPHLTEINYYVVLETLLVVEFTLAVFGRQGHYISPSKALKYTNSFDRFPSLPRYPELEATLKRTSVTLAWLH